MKHLLLTAFGTDHMFDGPDAFCVPLGEGVPERLRSLMDLSAEVEQRDDAIAGLHLLADGLVTLVRGLAADVRDDLCERELIVEDPPEGMPAEGIGAKVYADEIYFYGEVDETPGEVESASLTRGLLERMIQEASQQ